MGTAVGTTPPSAASVEIGPARWLGRGWLVGATALLVALFVDLLRVWMPSVVHVYGSAGSTPAAQLGAFAAIWFVAPLGASLLVRRVGPATLWRIAVAATALARVAVQWSDGGALQLWSACVGVLAAGVALVALGAGTPSGHLARVGVVVGLVASGVGHVALGTLDVVWRGGPLAAATTVVGCGAAVLAAERACRVPLWWPTARPADGALAPVWTRGAGWPWLGLGPSIALATILVAVPARFEIAAGWSPSVTALALALTGGVAIALAVLGPVLGGPISGSFGAVLVLVGTLGALRPSGTVAVVSQLALLAGIGAVLGAPGTTPGDAGPRRRGATVAASSLLLFLLGFAYYASYELPLPFPNRVVMVVGAVVLAAVGAAAAWTGRRLRRQTSVPVRTLVAVGVSVVVLGTGAAVAAPAAPGGPASPVDLDQLRVAAFNVHSGYGMDGRFDPDAVAAVLRDEDVDVVVLNEVDRGWLMEGGHDLLALLAARLDLPEVVFAPAADEVWGNAVLSRAPLRDVRVERLPRNGSPMSRSMVSVVVDVAPDRAVGIVGTHLHHVTDEPAVRLTQARAVAAEVSRLTSRGLPVALLGDLNAAATAPELEPLAFLVDAVPGDEPTYPADVPEVRLDHVLVTEGLGTSSPSIPATTASDHRPVVVTLEVADLAPPG